MKIIKLGCFVALASSISATASAGDLNYEVYGTVDLGVVYTDGDDLVAPEGSQIDFESGVRTGTLLGIRGNKKISEDNTFIFELESGFDLDDGSNTFDNDYDRIFGRHAWAGFTGSWGTAIAGRLDGGRATQAKKYDPFGEGTVGNMSSVLLVASRADQAVAYVSPRYNGWGITAAYTNNLIGQELPGNSGDNRVYSIFPSYEDGPVSITFNFEHSWYAKSDLPDLYVGILAGSYQFDSLKVFSYYEEVHVEGAPAVDLGDHSAFMIGGQLALPEGMLKFSALRNENESVDSLCYKYSLGYEREIHQDLVFYTTATAIDNKESANCTVAYSHTKTEYGPGGVGGFSGGYGDYGFDVGISYSFVL